MRKLILIVHTSLDGFVAGTKGELDGFDASEENLQFVCELTAEADAALFGRISYQLLNSYWPEAKDLPNASKGTLSYSTWYNNAQKIVISKTLAKERLDNTTFICDDIANAISDFKNQQGKDILIFGSPCVSQLLVQHNLRDSIWIFINPVILGQGIPLFTGSENKTTLKLVATKQFANGEIALHYVVQR